MIKWLLAILLFISCSPEKDIQVHPQQMVLVEIQQKQRGGQPIALLRWQGDGVVYWEFRSWPCELEIGRRETVYLIR